MIITTLDFPTGHTAFHRTYQRLLMTQMLLRPFISQRAAMKNGPIPRPRKYMESVIWAVDESIFKSWDMLPRAAAIILADIKVTSWLKEKTRPINTFRDAGQLYGLLGSSGPFQVAPYSSLSRASCFSSSVSCGARYPSSSLGFSSSVSESNTIVGPVITPSSFLVSRDISLITSRRCEVWPKYVVWSTGEFTHRLIIHPHNQTIPSPYMPTY